MTASRGCVQGRENGWFEGAEVGLENVAGDGFVELDVARGELGDEVGRWCGECGVFVGIAALAEPEAEEFLVDHVGLAAFGEALVVGGREPVAGGVGRVDLVDEDDGAFRRDAELVLGVDEDEAVLSGTLLAEGEEGERLF